MMKRLLAISAFLLASSAYAAPNLTGQWTIHQSIAGNESDQPCNLVAAGNKITGSCKPQDKELPVTGTVDGNKVTWQYQSEYNGSPLTLVYTATLGDSSKIAGTVEVKEFGITGDFTAVTSSATSQPGQAAAGQSGSGQVSAVTGQWTIHQSIAGNESDQPCNLVAAGNKITGSCKPQDKELPVTGTVDGNKVTWQYQSEYNGSPLTLIYTATLGDSGKIAGTVEVKEFGITGDFTAVTSSASSQSGPAPAGPSGLGDVASEQFLVVQAGPGGIFKNQADVGKANPAGTASFDAKSGVYTIESAGMNLWNKTDAFHMIWKKVSGDASLTSDIEFAAPTPGKSDPHRKAVVMFRQTLDVDSATAYVAVHGSGYTALQYRPGKGALTQEIAFDPDSPNTNPTPSRAASLADPRNHVAAPKIVRLEKRGDTITLFVSMKGEPLHPTGASIKLHFGEPFYVGLGVASHHDGQLEKAVFSHVELKPLNAAASAYLAVERPKITGLSHLAVFTSNPEATDHFYREVIGAVKLSDPENPLGVRYALSDTQFIEVLPLPAGAGVNRLDHSAWNTENAEQLRRYLAANNWKTPEKVEKGSDGSHWFEVLDPEGNKVQFVQLPPHSKPLVAPDVMGHHIIHIGFLVHSRDAEDKFYRTLLDFRPYWWGGRNKGKVDWVSEQSPDSTDWLEYMLISDPGTGIPANMSKMYLGVLDHFSIGENSVDDTLAKLQESGRLAQAGRLAGMPPSNSTQVGLDGKGQLNLFDPDWIRVEFMNFHHTSEPCCSPFTAPDPSK
jgi:catechol 2,3-dioxygenase-like lactoylglutathione lyase family enzyme